ncbi:hypothetical protein [Bradyrhizobium sp. McL0616]
MEYSAESVKRPQYFGTLMASAGRFE